MSGKAPELEVNFKLVEGEAKETGIAVAFDFSGWSTNNYVLAPAALYNGNRYRSLPINYPPYIYDEKQRPLDMPITVTDVPRLNGDGTSGKAELLTRNCATPMLALLKADGHTTGVGLAKAVAMELACRLTGLSQRAIGSRYGGVSSQAVSHARRRIKTEVSSDCLTRLTDVIRSVESQS